MILLQLVDGEDQIIHPRKRQRTGHQSCVGNEPHECAKSAELNMRSRTITLTVVSEMLKAESVPQPIHMTEIRGLFVGGIMYSGVLVSPVCRPEMVGLI